MAAFVPRLTDRQKEIWHEGRRFLLAEGPRKCGKSIGFVHKVYQHAVANSGAVVGLFSKTVSQTKRGAWSDLIGWAYDEWKEAGMTEMTVTPRHEMDTKMAYFRVRCLDGGESEIQIHSIADEDRIEEKVKDMRFSMIYMIEADRFDEASFRALELQLRSMRVPYHRQQLLLDCNPAATGRKHWIYKLFFNRPDYIPLEDWQAQYKRIHFTIDDNPHLTDQEKRGIYQAYAHDRAKLARYWFGEWVEDNENSVFAEQFMADIHVVGEEPPMDKTVPADKLTTLRPARLSSGLHLGWDIGDVNHAVVIGCPRVVDGVGVYDIVDEVIQVDVRTKLQDLVEEVVAKMDYWEKYILTHYGRRVPERHWSDNSSLRYRADIGGDQALLIERFSRGRINLEGVEKGAGSVAAGLDMIQRFLFEERLFIGSNCPQLAAMFRGLVKGRTKAKDDAVDPKSPHKHAFDALRYMLAYGMPEEMLYSAQPIAASSTPTRAIIL